MSKEKLQEIKKNNDVHDLYLLPREVDELMELAYNQALEDANEVVFYEGLDFVRSEDYNQKSEHRFSDIQQSILKLKIK